MELRHPEILSLLPAERALAGGPAVFRVPKVEVPPNALIVVALPSAPREPWNGAPERCAGRAAEDERQTRDTEGRFPAVAGELALRTRN